MAGAERQCGVSGGGRRASVEGGALVAGGGVMSVGAGQWQQSSTTIPVSQVASGEN